VALALSLLLHWMIADGWHPGGGPSRTEAALQPLHARLERPADVLAPPASEPPGTGPGVALAPRHVDVRGALPARPERPPPSTASRQEAGASVPDPQVYAARDLDRYPMLLMPLGIAGMDGAYGMRFWLGIDINGAVFEVSPHDAGADGTRESTARDILLAARFEPAIKNGRPVKSRILLELR
jgi:hypothetical protein